jgi:LCP family protein required for cell wall assembly
MNSSRSPLVAALLSFLLPGLGQLYAGRFRRGIALALPTLAAVAVVLVAFGAGWSRVLDLLVRPEVVVLLLVANVVLLAYHLAAVVDAHRVATAWSRGAQVSRQDSARGMAVVPLALILVATVVLHAVPEFYGIRAAQNLSTIFARAGTADDRALPEPGWATASPTPGTSPGAAGPSPGASSAAEASPDPVGSGQPTPGMDAIPTPAAGPDWAADGRLNIVLLGSDEGPGRWSLRTDAVFLLSVDTATARAALFGFPRYMSNIPLPPESAANFENGRFPGYLNALYVRAQGHPDRFPGNDSRGLRVVAGAVQELAGVRVDDYVMVNLNGFVDVVDAMGGLWIDVPEAVRDDRYRPETGGEHIDIRIRPGCQKLDGRMALAYARSRHQDSDYARLGRQEVTLRAMRRQFDPLAVLPQLPQLFDVAGENLFWTLEPEDVSPMAALAARVDPDRMQRVLFTPPEYDRELPAETVDRIRATVRGIFDEPEPEPSATPGAADCPPRT